MRFDVSGQPRRGGSEASDIERMTWPRHNPKSLDKTIPRWLEPVRRKKPDALICQPFEAPGIDFVGLNLEQIPPAW